MVRSNLLPPPSGQTTTASLWSQQIPLEGWYLTTKLHGITALRSLNVVYTML